MLSPEYLKEIVEATEERVNEVNEYLVDRMVKRIVKLLKSEGKLDIIPASQLDIRKMENAGKLLGEIVEEIEQQFPTIRKEIRKAFLDAAEKIEEQTNETIKTIVEVEKEKGNFREIEIPESLKGNIPNGELNMTETEIRMLESAYRRTMGEVYNLTRTAPTAAQNTYIEACDTAYFKITHGVSVDTAVVEAIKEVAKKGIETVYYESGHKDKIEVAIARAARTGISQADGDITLTRCAETGVNYVLTTSHLGARVTPFNDYRTHADWQGKVYRLDWNKKNLKKYIPKENETPKGKLTYLNELNQVLSKTSIANCADFIEVCGYGKMLGICGINCRHSFGMFYPGISINNQREYDSEENLKRYKLEQKQRAKERKIREIKRQLNALENSELDTEEVKNEKRRLKKLLEKKDGEYHQFCKDNKLKSLNYRLQVAKTKGIENNIKVSVDDESDLGDKIKKMFGLKSESPREIFNKKVASVKNDDARVLLQQSEKRTVFEETKTLGSRYHNKKVTLGKNATDSTVAHELFHEIDDTYGLTENGFLKDSIDNDYRKLCNIAKGYGKSIEEMLYFKYPEAFYRTAKGKLKVYEQYRGISDILHGVSKGEIYLGYGHHKEGYWEQEKKLQKETFAQFGRMLYEQDENVLTMASEIFSETNIEVLERLRGMIK